MPIDWTALAAALANAGGWAVVLLMGIGLSVGFVKGWIVPGFVYQREVTRADAATAAISGLSASFDRLTEEVRWDVRDRISAERAGQRRERG